MGVRERLGVAARKAGVGIEQLGLDAGVHVFVEDDEITLSMGDRDLSCEDEGDALDHIEAYAEKVGADAAVVGAVVALVKELNALAKELPRHDRQDFLRDEARLASVAERHGAGLYLELEGDDGVVRAADDEGDLGFFIDDHEVTWQLTISEGVVSYLLDEVDDD